MNLFHVIVLAHVHQEAIETINKLREFVDEDPELYKRLVIHELEIFG